MRDRNRTSIGILASLFQGDVVLLIREFLRHFLTQVDCQEALREFDSVELRSQRLQDLLPVAMAGQAASWRAADAVLAVQLDIERVEGVAAGRKSDTDGVVVCRFVAGGVDLILGFVQFEAYLREVVELGNCISSNLGLHTAFEDAVEQRVDMRLLGEVDERLGIVGSLNCRQKVSVRTFFESCVARLDVDRVLPSSMSLTISFSNGKLVRRPISSFSASVIPYS